MSLARDLRDDADVVRGLPAELSMLAAERYVAALGLQVRRDAGPDGRLSGMGASGSELTVDVTVQPAADAWTVSVSAAPRPMRRAWAWLNAGTRARRQRRGRHPGTPPRRTFDGPIEEVTPEVLATVDAHFFGAPIGGRP